VRHVAQVHGGDVTVESTEGEGSTFRFRVPLPSSAERNLSEAS
jgi:signal transduction histidine kinase